MKISIQNLQDKIPVTVPFTEQLKRIITAVLSEEGVKKDGEITVCLMDNAAIRQLNKEHLGHDTSTDVIAFTFPHKKMLKADIAISTEEACANAVDYSTTPLYEVYLYVAHGMLHVLGYDDDTDREREMMQEKAEGILKKIT